MSHAFSASRRSALITLSSSLALAACGGGGDDAATGQVRFINATSDAEPMDVSFDNDDRDEIRIFSAVPRNGQADYLAVGTGSYQLRLKRAGSSTTQAFGSITVDKNTAYSIVAYGREGSMRLTAFSDNIDAPSAGKTKLRVFNTSNDTGAVDVYLADSQAALDTGLPLQANAIGGGATPFIETERGSYRLRVTGIDDRADIRLDLPAFTLADREIMTMILQPGAGGVLVHALAARQGGALSVHENPSARVRLVAGVTDNAAVSASAGGVSLNVNLRAPSVGRYALVPAGALDVQVSVARVAGAASLGGRSTVVAGGDYSLLVSGETAAPAWSLVADDNRLPTASNKARMRLVHAAVGYPAGLTLAKDFLAVASDVAYGSASAYTQVDASTNSRIEVTSPGSTNSPLLLTDTTVSGNAVYTVFMLGGGNTAQGVMRRER